MYRVSPALQRLAMALLIGAGLGTLWVNISPGSYYDFAEWRLFGARLPRWMAETDVLITPVVIVGEAFMALFVALIAKEFWEAVAFERGPLSGPNVQAPIALVLGGIFGAVGVWLGLVLVLGLHDDLSVGWGWSAPIGADTVLAFLFGRMIFGAGHPALKLLLLMTITESLVGLLISGLFSPEHQLRPFWLILPALAAFAVWRGFGHTLRPAAQQREHRRRDVIWPYIIAGFVSWTGVLAAGLPGALGLLPIIPAIAHANRSFGLFAEAEELLHDPLNRLAHILVWPATVALFAFGVTYGAIDLMGFAALTLVMLAALWAGKPLGVLATAALLMRLGRPGPLRAIAPRDLRNVALLMGIAFTTPALALPWSLPGGGMSEAARLGLALSLMIGPVLVLWSRKRG
jgi:Na+:H+ antiporter, NhaA family